MGEHGAADPEQADGPTALLYRAEPSKEVKHPFIALPLEVNHCAGALKPGRGATGEDCGGDRQEGGPKVASLTVQTATATSRLATGTAGNVGDPDQGRLGGAGAALVRSCSSWKLT